MQKMGRASSVAALQPIAEKIIATFPLQRKFAFYGEMGAGKTTFIKCLCSCLGVSENTSSPTFAIVNEYAGKEKIYHFDLFRIRSLKELNEIGIAEYLQSGDYIFIEWPEMMEDIIMEDQFMRIVIEVSADGMREISIL